MILMDGWMDEGGDGVQCHLHPSPSADYLSKEGQMQAIKHRQKTTVVVRWEIVRIL